MRYVMGFCAVLAVVPLAAQPVINTGGAVNAASYSLVGLPNSAIAQGSIFSVFGQNLGPAVAVKAASFPLSTTLAATSAKVTVNGATVSPIMLFTSASQASMVMPSSTPVGAGTIAVTYNGQTSAPVAIQVSAADFGVFTVNQAGSGSAVVTDAGNTAISLTHAANPGQVLVLWGTGLGKISTDETQPPPAGNVGAQAPVVWVGSQQAVLDYWGRSSCCSGVDQINFHVPAGIAGCYVPVAVQTGGTVSNFATIAVAGSGSVCSDPVGLSSAQLTQVQNGQPLNVATLALSRATRSVPTFPAPLPPTVTTTDSGSASFVRYTPTQITDSSFGQAVSVGGCTVFTINGAATVADPIQPLGLDAGASVTVGGSNGNKVLQPLPSAKGYYGATLGSSANPPSFLDVGLHTFNIPGGADVAAFTQDVQMPPSLTWTNQSDISSVRESQGVTLNWTNGPPNGYVRITGYSFGVDQLGNLAAGAIFYCTANAGANGAGQFTVPPPVLLNLPLSVASTSSLPIPTGFLGIGSQAAQPDRFNLVRGIDVGFVSASVSFVKTVTYTP